jgi:hypothetical protein
VGSNNDGTITDCYATGSVEGGFDTNCGNTTGGLVGYNYKNGTITDCYATGKVTGGDDTGGLVGCNYGAHHQAVMPLAI